MHVPSPMKASPEFARAVSLQTNGHLQTSNDSIYAIGDIAAFPMPRYGGKVTRQEHVQNARESAKHAVTAIMAPSEASEYNYLPVRLKFNHRSASTPCLNDSMRL